MSGFHLLLLSGAAKRSLMLRALLYMAMALSVLICSMDTPALAHSFDGSASHADIAADVNFDAADGENEEDGRSPSGHAVHHHCHGELEARLFAIDESRRGRESLPHPQAFAAMASRADAPLTEPPAA